MRRPLTYAERLALAFVAACVILGLLMGYLVDLLYRKA